MSPIGNFLITWGSLSEPCLAQIRILVGGVTLHTGMRVTWPLSDIVLDSDCAQLGIVGGGSRIIYQTAHHPSFKGEGDWIWQGQRNWVMTNSLKSMLGFEVHQTINWVMGSSGYDTKTYTNMCAQVSVYKNHPDSQTCQIWLPWWHAINHGLLGSSHPSNWAMGKTRYDIETCMTSMNK